MQIEPRLQQLITMIVPGKKFDFKADESKAIF